MNAKEARTLTERHSIIRNFIIQVIEEVAKSGRESINTEVFVYANEQNYKPLTDSERKWLADNGYIVSDAHLHYADKEYLVSEIRW